MSVLTKGQIEQYLAEMDTELAAAARGYRPSDSNASANTRSETMVAVPGRIDEPTSAGPNMLVSAEAIPIVSTASFEAALAEAGL